MKLKNMLFILIIVSALTAAAAGGLATRMSYVNNVDVTALPDKISDYDMALEEESWLSKIYFDNQLQSFSELKKKADLIAKVRPAAERKLLNQALLSPVEIVEIYQGEDAKAGDCIYIYEPTFLSNEQVYIPDGYIMQLDQREYIFFLKKLKAPEGYRYRGREKISYLPVSTAFGKYAVQDAPTAVIQDKDLTFGAIKNMDIVTTNLQTLAKYREFKKEVRKLEAK